LGGKKKGRATGGGGNNDRCVIGIKEKRPEKGEKEECMETNVHIDNKWWKIMTIYSKDKYNNKRCRRYNKRKQRILYALGRGFQGQNRRKRNKKLGREGKENSVIRWNMQRGRD
jgi:hypothetical protein